VNHFKNTMTTVVNLFGGPGIGKSTIAAQLYSHLKFNKNNVELVQETAKRCVYLNRVPNYYDPLFFLGQQSFSESLLYGKVDYVITDSPILLAGIYQEYQSDSRYNYVTTAAREFISHAKTNSVMHYNFYLQRDDEEYDNSGRFKI
jgi:ABC-type cobalamin/Fe3+-siderophores transport system ATPase subunit